MPPDRAWEWYVCEEFGDWYAADAAGEHARSLQEVVEHYLTELLALRHALPTLAFRQRFDAAAARAVEAPRMVRACDLCAERCEALQFCDRCVDKQICRDCWLKTAWSAQHDEERVFHSWRPVHCPFCRQTLGRLNNLIDTGARSRRKSKR